MALYHGSPNVKGDTLVPHNNDVCTGRENGNFVFAGPNMATAYVYAFKLGDESRQSTDAHGQAKRFQFMCNTTNFGDVSAGVIGEREKFLAQLQKAHPTVYEVPPGSFQPVLREDGTATGEFRSTAPILLKDCKATPVASLDEAMHKGAQFFFLTDAISKDTWFKLADAELGTPEFAKISEAQRKEKQLRFYQRMVKEGVLIHENASRGINPLNLQTGEVEWNDNKKEALLPVDQAKHASAWPTLMRYGGAALSIAGTGAVIAASVAAGTFVFSPLAIGLMGGALLSFGMGKVAENRVAEAYQTIPASPPAPATAREPISHDLGRSDGKTWGEVVQSKPKQLGKAA